MKHFVHQWCKRERVHLFMEHTGEGGISHQVKFVLVNFAVGNFVEPPGAKV